MSYNERYKNLNLAQQKAVDTIDGPVVIIAGPGTGKTELLSMRAASILKKTDTLPESILCLTFTESGAHAMRERMASIFGAAAYKVPIHTFHSFGSEIINQYGEYFYEGASFQPADELTSHELLVSLFEALPHSSPLRSTMNGEFTYLRDTQTTISELKRSGLTPAELLQVLSANQEILDSLEADLQQAFSIRVSKSTIDTLRPIALAAAQLDTSQQSLPRAIAPLSNVLALSLARAIDEAESDNSTKPITAWKNLWLEKNASGNLVFKDRARTNKLHAVANLYQAYLEAMQSQGRYDFDDMILRVLHAIETHDELRYNLQERYLYMMVDEFQDTNLAQMRLLYNLTSLDNGDSPNLMIVGDDDQAIYSFQGAELSNLTNFIHRFETATRIVLTDNYRSSKTILDNSQKVIRRAGDRLEAALGLDKTLNAHHTPQDTYVVAREFNSTHHEYEGITQSIHELISSGTAPEDIAIIARRHHELISLLPYLQQQSIAVNYERRNNILDDEIIICLILLARTVVAIASSKFSEANALLPELLAHPSLKLEADAIWKLSLRSYTNRSSWLEEMALDESLKTLHTWLLEQARQSLTTPIEQAIDQLIGTPEASSETPSLYHYFFSDDNREQAAETYLTHLNALRAIRQKLRDFKPGEALHLADFVHFVDLHQAANQPITTITQVTTDDSAIQLLTAHKAKGLEYPHVFIIGATDSAWGERVRARSRLIRYPENLPLAPAGDTIDERLRLFFVAMTRAKDTLTISYSTASNSGKPLMPASFVAELDIETIIEPETSSVTDSLLQATIDWRGAVTNLPQSTIQALLATQLTNYKLSATHLNNFLDVSRGGPQHFLLNNLLHFPQSMSPDAAFGSAIHVALQHAHSFNVSKGRLMPNEDIHQEFMKALQKSRLTTSDSERLLSKGIATLDTYLASDAAIFTATQKPELSFANQHSLAGEVHLTGILDVVDINKADKTLTVIDYKTGKPSQSWQGKTDHEKIKLHKYRQQLLFYELLIRHSRDYHDYRIEFAGLQFVEALKTGEIPAALSLRFSDEELDQFTKLITMVWRHITNVTLPDISSFTPDYKGLLDFEQSLIDSYI